MVDERWSDMEGFKTVQRISSEVTIQLEAGAFGTLFQAPSFIQSKQTSAPICLSSWSGVPTSSVD